MKIPELDKSDSQSQTHTLVRSVFFHLSSLKVLQTPHRIYFHYSSDHGLDRGLFLEGSIKNNCAKSLCIKNRKLTYCAHAQFYVRVSADGCMRPCLKKRIQYCRQMCFAGLFDGGSPELYLSAECITVLIDPHPRTRRIQLSRHHVRVRLPFPI